MKGTTMLNTSALAQWITGTIAQREAELEGHHRSGHDDNQGAFYTMGERDALQRVQRYLELVEESLFVRQVSTFFTVAQGEVLRANQKHAPLNSHHEAYAVILEELDEYKAEVWKQTKNRDLVNMRTELIQLAAMCARAAVDLGLMSDEVK